MKSYFYFHTANLSALLGSELGIAVVTWVTKQHICCILKQI